MDSPEHLVSTPDGYLPLQFGDPVLFGPALAVALKGFAPVLPQFLIPEVKHVGVHLTSEGPLLQSKRPVPAVSRRLP